MCLSATRVIHAQRRPHRRPLGQHDLELSRAQLFEHTELETKVIVDRSIVEGYRICVGEGAHSVPLKVTANLSDTIVPAGECETFHAQFIRITPAGALEKDSVLIGTYERLRV
jgi:hypothetical protein